MRFALKLKKGDIIAVLFAVLLTAAAFIPYFSRSRGGLVSVSLNGEQIALLDLHEDTEYPVHGDFDATVVIHNGKVCVKNSTCPGKDCENCGEISAAGASIVCLPNRLTVTVSGGDTDAVIG